MEVTLALSWLLAACSSPGISVGLSAASSLSQGMDGGVSPLAPAITAPPPTCTLDTSLQVVLTAPAPPRREVVFVLDSSASLGSTGWAAVKAYTIGLVNGLSPSDYVGVVQFSTGVFTRHAFTSNQQRSAVVNAINNMSFLDGTAATLAAMQAAVDIFETQTRGLERVIILVTDGPPNPASQTPCGISTEAQALRADPARLDIYTHVVASGPDLSPGILGCLVASDPARVTDMTTTPRALSSRSHQVNLCARWGTPLVAAGTPTASAGTVTRTGDQLEWAMDALEAGTQATLTVPVSLDTMAALANPVNLLTHVMLQSYHPVRLSLVTLPDVVVTVTAPTWFADADTDGHPGTPQVSCMAPAGGSATATDCDDTRPDVNPGEAEACGNTVDDDCNPATPDACPASSSGAGTSSLAPPSSAQGASSTQGATSFADGSSGAGASSGAAPSSSGPGPSSQPPVSSPGAGASSAAVVTSLPASSVNGSAGSAATGTASSGAAASSASSASSVGTPAASSAHTSSSAGASAASATASGAPGVTGPGSSGAHPDGGERPESGCVCARAPEVFPWAPGVLSLLVHGVLRRRRRAACAPGRWQPPRPWPRG